MNFLTFQQGRELLHADYVRGLLCLFDVQHSLGEVGTDLAGPLQGCTARKRGPAPRILQVAGGEGGLQRYPAAGPTTGRDNSRSQRRPATSATTGTTTGEAGVL